MSESVIVLPTSDEISDILGLPKKPLVPVKSPEEIEAERVAALKETYPSFLLKPLGAFSQVRLLDDYDGTTESGIAVVEKHEQKTRICEVLSIGPGMFNPFNGGRFELDIHVGCLLFVNQHAPVVIRHLKRYSKEPITYMIAYTDVFSVYMSHDEALAEGLVLPLTERPSYQKEAHTLTSYVESVDTEDDL